MTALVPSKPEPDTYEVEGSMHKYGGWVIVSRRITSRR